jgi:hypothetical protein
MSASANLAPMGMVKTIKAANFPDFFFEYHPVIGKVYLVDKTKILPNPENPTVPKYEAEVIAEHVDTEGRAFGFVQTYLRGFQRGKRDKVVAPTIIEKA